MVNVQFLLTKFWFGDHKNMFVVFCATILVLTGAIFGDTVIKDNPAQFKAIATDGNGKQIPVSGEMDTIQVFDIHPAGENYTDPGLSIDISVTPLNETDGEQAHPPAATTYPNPTYNQVASTFTLPSDYNKINNALPPTATFANETAFPLPAHSTVLQNSANLPMITPVPHPVSRAGITPTPGHRNKVTSPSSLPYPNAGQNENLSTTPSTMRPPTDTNSFSNPASSATNPYAPNFSQNLIPFRSVNPQNPAASQNPFSGFPFNDLQTLRNPPTFPTDQNESPFNLPNASSMTAENPFNISSPHPFQSTTNPFAPTFGQNTNPFNIFNRTNAPPGENPNIFSPANAFTPTTNRFAPADKNVNPFVSFPTNPFTFTNPFAINFAENPYEPTAKPLADNPFNPFTPTSTQNILPLGGSLFNKKSPFATGGFPTATSPNPFLPNFGGAGMPLFGGKPNRVTGPNPEENSIAVMPPSSDDHNETASSTEHQSSSLLGKLFNLFGSGKNSSGYKNVEYDSEISPNANDSGPNDYSDIMAKAPSHNVNTDFINPLIYKAYFDPTMWNKFTNITDFDDTNSLGNAINPFAAFNPFASPLAFMRNINPWSPGNVNNPWNPNNFNQALLNLTSLKRTPTSSFGAGFNLPPYGAGSPSPWIFNTSTPGLLEIYRNGSTTEFNESSMLQNVNTSLLPPVAFAASSSANSINGKLPMPQRSHLNLPAGVEGATNISDLMKNVRESIVLLTGNTTSQALLLKSLTDSDNNMNWPPAAFSQNAAKLAPAPSPSPAASYGAADESDNHRQSEVQKSIEELPSPQPIKSPIEVETIPANSLRDNDRGIYYADDSIAAEDYNETLTETVNGNTVAEAPQNGAIIIILSSWMMVIGIVVGVIAQKMCN